MRRLLAAAAFVVVGAGATVVLVAGGCEPPPPDRVAVDLGVTPIPGDSRPTGWMRFSVVDEETGALVPARVVIASFDVAPPPRFDVDPRTGLPNGGDDAAHLGPGVLGAPEGVLLVNGDGAVRMPLGTYDLMVTRGPEWELYQRRVTLRAGPPLVIEAGLRHSVDTRGWLAADMHVHTARSNDSVVGLEARVVSEVTVGVEVIVATDHNVLTDLQPAIEDLGYRELARAFVGDEFSYFEGHGGAFPLPYDRSDVLSGGATAFGLDPLSVRWAPASDVFDRLRALPARPVVTVHHPRLQPNLGYFSNLRAYGDGGWTPPTPLPTAGRFDALEVINGFASGPGDVALLLRDWFFLLSSGHRVTALGNSDTHRLRDVRAGFPRSWLRLPTEAPRQLDEAALAAALRAQRAIASTGPFALLTVDGAQIGDTLQRQGGAEVQIDALVDAPEWIDVNRVTLWINGKKARELSVIADSRPRFHVRWRETLPSGDSWIALSAAGSKPLPMALIGERGGGGVLPFVITNPVFVDGDGDGQWRPRIATPDPGPLAAPTAPLPPPAAEEWEPPEADDPAEWANP